MHNVLPLRWRREPMSPHMAHAAPVVDASPVDVQRVDPTPIVPLATMAPAIDGSSSAPPAPSVVRVDAVKMRSLVSIALRCVLVAVIVGCLGATALWLAATATGVVGRTESFMQSIGFRGFRLSAVEVIAGTALIVGGIALGTATAVVVMGAAYNAFALNAHGLELRVHALAFDEPDDELAPATPLIPSRAAHWSPATPERSPAS